MYLNITLRILTCILLSDLLYIKKNTSVLTLIYEINAIFDHFQQKHHLISNIISHLASKALADRVRFIAGAGRRISVIRLPPLLLARRGTI